MGDKEEKTLEKKDEGLHARYSTVSTGSTYLFQYFNTIRGTEYFDSGEIEAVPKGHDQCEPRVGNNFFLSGKDNNTSMIPFDTW